MSLAVLFRLLPLGGNSDDAVVSWFQHHELAVPSAMMIVKMNGIHFAELSPGCWLLVDVGGFLCIPFTWGKAPRNHRFGWIVCLGSTIWVHNRADFFFPFWEVLKLTGRIFAIRKWHIHCWFHLSDWETIEVPYAVLYPHLWRDQRQKCHKLHLRRGLRPHLRWLWLGLKIASQLFFFPACWDLSARWCSLGLDGTDILAADLCQNDAWLMDLKKASNMDRRLALGCRRCWWGDSLETLDDDSQMSQVFFWDFEILQIYNPDMRWYVIEDWWGCFATVRQHSGLHQFRVGSQCLRVEN